MNNAAAVNNLITLSSIPAIGTALPGGVMVGFMPADGERPAYLLISPPIDAKAPRMKWGPYDDEIEGLSDWDGAANTKLLVARDEKHPAAQHCASLEHDGFNDYYLPSRCEASLIAGAAGRLFPADLCWTSSQYSAYHAFVQDFSDGYQSTFHKDNEWRVRAVRRSIID
jgi:hypothetical protein